MSTYYRIALWVCDNKDCLCVNRREIPPGHMIYDDQCDFCDKRIHEPIVNIVNIEDRNEPRTEDRRRGR